MRSLLSTVLRLTVCHCRIVHCSLFNAQHTHTHTPHIILILCVFWLWLISVRIQTKNIFELIMFNWMETMRNKYSEHLLNDSIAVWWVRATTVIWYYWRCIDVISNVQLYISVLFSMFSTWLILCVCEHRAHYVGRLLWQCNDNVCHSVVAPTY